MRLWFTAWVCQHHRDGHQEVSPPEESSKGEKGADAVLFCVYCMYETNDCIVTIFVSVSQSVYGVVDDTQTQSPVHTPCIQQSSKDTREDVEKEVCASDGVNLILNSLIVAINI